MKIEKRVVDNPILNELIESNNQQEHRLDIISFNINQIKSDFTKLKDEFYKRKSHEY